MSRTVHSLYDDFLQSRQADDVNQADVANIEATLGQARAKATDSSRTKNDKFAALSDGTPDGVYVIGTDALIREHGSLRVVPIANPDEDLDAAGGPDTGTEEPPAEAPTPDEPAPATPEGVDAPAVA